MNLDDNLCLCFRVNRRKLLKYIRLYHPKVPSQLSMCGGAGTGCGWCIPYLKQLFLNAQSDTLTDLDSISAEEYEQNRKQYIREGKGTPPKGAEPEMNSEDESQNNTKS